jgi:hypothetical protein
MEAAISSVLKLPKKRVWDELHRAPLLAYAAAPPPILRGVNSAALPDWWAARTVNRLDLFLWTWIQRVEGLRRVGICHHDLKLEA